jgi:hypothetical protein
MDCRLPAAGSWVRSAHKRAFPCCRSKELGHGCEIDDPAKAGIPATQPASLASGARRGNSHILDRHKREGRRPWRNRRSRSWLGHSSSGPWRKGSSCADVSGRSSRTRGQCSIVVMPWSILISAWPRTALPGRPRTGGCTSGKELESPQPRLGHSCTRMSIS